MKWLALVFCFLSAQVFAQEGSETREFLGQLGGRTALMHLYAIIQPDGSARITGEYLLLPTMQQRFLEGERSKQLGITFLKEGDTPILYGRPPSATLQGTWADGVFKGGRYGPGGQQRERFEFSEAFPPMDAYSANLRCEVSEGRYASTLALSVDNGKLKSLDWRSKVSPGDQPCALTGPRTAAAQRRIAVRDGPLQRDAAPDRRLRARHRGGLRRDVRLAGLPRAAAGRSQRQLPAAAPAGEVAMAWEIVVGIETHAQLLTKSKIFSGASTAFGAAPNTQASAVDIALPGVLPVLNAQAVELAARFGLAVGGDISRRSVFARKNYFYPDLPKGYQISQYEIPVVQGGSLKIVLPEGEKTIRLTRAHLEEDAGKSLHEDFRGMTGIDLNRAGTPLLEIVSEPDLRGAREAVAYAQAMHAWCAGSASATATCRKAPSAATPMSRCAKRATRSSARAARSKT